MMILRENRSGDWIARSATFTTANATHTHHSTSGGMSRKVVVPSAAVFHAGLVVPGWPGTGAGAARLVRSAGTGPAALADGTGSAGTGPGMACGGRGPGLVPSPGGLILL